MSAKADGVQSAINKWLAAEPHWQVGQVFLPTPARAQHVAWLALLFELRETLFAASDASIRQHKGAWWAEELLGWSRGAFRHPLGQPLHGVAADWASLASALLPLLSEAPPDASVDAALLRLRPAAEAVLAVEAAITGNEVGAIALARHWLWREWQHSAALSDLGRLPMNLRARHGVRGAQSPDAAAGIVADWGRALAMVSIEPGVGYLRCLEARSDERRLATRSPWAPWQALWPAWRAARQAAARHTT